MYRQAGLLAPLYPLHLPIRHRMSANSGFARARAGVTAAGPRPIYTGFPLCLSPPGERTHR